MATVSLCFLAQTYKHACDLLIKLYPFLNVVVQFGCWCFKLKNLFNLFSHCLNYFWPIFLSIPPENMRKSGSLIFSEVIKRQHWPKMGWAYIYWIKLLVQSKLFCWSQLCRKNVNLVIFKVTYQRGNEVLSRKTIFEYFTVQVLTMTYFILTNHWYSGNLEVNTQFLSQIDKLVQMIESPIFTCK